MQAGRLVSVFRQALVPLGYPVFLARVIVYLDDFHMDHLRGGILGWDQVKPSAQIEDPFGNCRCGPGLADLFLKY
jgi:hypothetical protein